MMGTLTKVMTLLMTVGWPKSPAIAGSGGLARTMPRLPSMLSSIAVSSPHTYEPAPLRTSSVKALPEPRMSGPRNPADSAWPIASRYTAIECGYSERT